MTKVIKHGYSRYRITCDDCQCYFEYEISDVAGDGTVECPDCKRPCYHNATLNVDLTSQLMKDKRIEEIKRLKEGDCFHGEIWYTCPHCGKGIEAHSIAESDDNIHICSSCGGKYYYSRFEKI